MEEYPAISIIIVTFNSHRTIVRCLENIKNQSYQSISEVLLIDGGSTDDTLYVAKKSGLPIKIIKGGYKDNQEARRAIGVENAKSEICAMIDTDNYIEDKDWLKRMVEPLIEHTDVIASQTLRYAAPSGASALNRYFGLIGGGDPVAYYLNKNDRLSFAFDKWNLKGNVIDENGRYYIVDFEVDNYPTVGCNGIVFKRSVLLKSNWKNPENYIHTDVFVDIAKLGFTKFAIVKNEIFHDTAEDIWTFVSKKRRYMRIYHQKLNKRRRHLTFDPHSMQDVARLALFILYAVTIIEPLMESIRGYIKKKDIAWFLHPIICFEIMVVYFEATARFAFNKLSK